MPLSAAVLAMGGVGEFLDMGEAVKGRGGLVVAYVAVDAYAQDAQVYAPGGLYQPVILLRLLLPGTKKFPSGRSVWSMSCLFNMLRQLSASSPPTYSVTAKVFASLKLSSPRRHMSPRRA